MFTRTCEYAVRAATYIAEYGAEKPVLARDVAAYADVPLKYLQKVLRDMVRSGVLKSARGIGGGFRLARPAGKVSLMDVVAPFDDVLRRSNCPFGNPQCGIANPCPVHDRWGRVMGSYQRFLTTTTLGKLVKKR